MKAKIEELNFNPNEYASLEQEQESLKSSIVELHELHDKLNTQLSARLKFQYKDPVRGFDRSKVKGLVANLINVSNPEHSTALEVVAGGKLFQVVVDEAITGKALLDRGQLERRVTIIPLDKIKASGRLSRATTDKAQQIAQSRGGGSDKLAQPAIELVGYDEEIQSAIEYVFGSAIVVDGMKAANLICDTCKVRTVTLDGDVYDPSGTISGGSKNQLGTTLSKLTEMAQAASDLENQQARLEVVEEQLKATSPTSTKYEKWSGQLELAETELQATLKHLSQTQYGILTEKRDTMQSEMDEAREQRETMEKESKEKWELYENLKEQEQELSQKREDRLKAMEQEVKDAKKDSVSKTKSAREVR